MKLSSGKFVAAWSMSATSNASLSSGQIVGPLWTWMFLTPSSWHGQVALGHRVGQAPPAGVPPPLCGVELDALDAVRRDLLLELGQAPVAVSRVPRAVEDEPVRVLVLQLRVAGGGVEPVDVEVRQVGRLEDADIDVTVDEHVLDHRFLVVLLVLLPWPDVLRGRQTRVVVVETRDEPLAVLVLLVLRASVPPVDVPVDHEVFVASGAAIHGCLRGG